jgi:hypothetical protein
MEFLPWGSITTLWTAIAKKISWKVNQEMFLSVGKTSRLSQKSSSTQASFIIPFGKCNNTFLKLKTTLTKVLLFALLNLNLQKLKIKKMLLTRLRIFLEDIMNKWKSKSVSFKITMKTEMYVSVTMRYNFKFGVKNELKLQY